MGYYLQVDLKPMAPLASLGGWADFKAWVGSLPPGKAMALRHLCAYGWCQDVGAVKQGLETALQKQPPADHTIQSTAADLLETLGDGTATVVSVTDGWARDGDD